jgi:hypothetical protein
MKIFKGYYIIGTSSKEEAKEGKGMMLWSQKTPSKPVQFFNRILLNIYWVDNERIQLNRGEKLQNDDTELPKNLPNKIKK